MKYLLRGNLVRIISSKLNVLYGFMDIVMDNGKFYFQNNSDYYLGLEILKNKKLITETQYKNEAKVLYKGIYNEKLEKELVGEDYKVITDENSATLYNEERGKYLSFVKVKRNNIDNYIIIAKDSHIDKTAMDSRDIPFIIRKDSPIYDTVRRYYKKNRRTYILSKDKDKKQNHIRIDKDMEGNFRLIVIKQRNAEKPSTNTRAVINFGNEYNNEKCGFASNIFDKLSTKKEQIEENIKQKVLI